MIHPSERMHIYFLKRKPVATLTDCLYRNGNIFLTKQLKTVTFVLLNVVKAATDIDEEHFPFVMSGSYRL